MNKEAEDLINEIVLLILRKIIYRIYYHFLFKSNSKYNIKKL